MNLSESIFVIGSLAVFSLSDLRYRTVPGAGLFFLASALMGMRDDPLQAAAVVGAVGWGLVRRLPTMLAFPAMLHPAGWSVLPVAVGVRREWLGRADLLIIGVLACTVGLKGVFAALIGALLWHRLWTTARPDSTPAVPGYLLGVFGFVFWRLLTV